MQKNLSREELFALVWEKPTSEIAKDFDLSDVAIGKLCTKLQVPKPPRGYWARIEAGQKPRRPALAAFREEIESNRRDQTRLRAAESLTPVQREILEVAVDELRSRGVDLREVAARGTRPLSHVDPDLAAQILLLVQGQARKWMEDGRINRKWGNSVRSSLSQLVERLVPIARPQVLLFEPEKRRSHYTPDGPVVFVRLTAALQERMAGLVRLVRDMELDHVVLPLSAADHAWTTHHVHSPSSHSFLDSWLCVSGDKLWVEWSQKAWREDEPPERHATNRILLHDVMAIDYLPASDKALSPLVSAQSIKPYADRLAALREAEHVFELVSNATCPIQNEVPPEVLSIVERLWFGQERPFKAAREALRHVETELERWEKELEAERSSLAQSILGIVPGDIVTSESRGKLVRISVTNLYLYSSEDRVTFMASGIRFRKDGTLGKTHESITLGFEEKPSR